ncbi:MAG: hypothetical protein O2907_05710 [Proteobacteria bacterium]|nr:hypothetical protein [Pseudomonadota bacterium]
MNALNWKKQTLGHLCTKPGFSEGAGNPPTSHARRMPCLYCELPNLLQDSMPPDPEFVDLIEQAFIQGQIDGLKADLAYAWLEANKG